MAEQSGKSGSGDGDKKISKQEILNGIVDAMLGEATLLPIEQFGAIFHLVEPEPGKKLVLEELEDGVVRYVDEQRVINQIIDFCHEIVVIKHPETGDLYKIFNRDAEKVFELWRSRKKPLETHPAIVLEKGAPGLTFRRLPFSIRDVALDWDRMEMSDKNPYWFIEFASRCTNARALFAFIGSLLVPEADRQQYVYMWGEGQNGKGSLIRLLDWVLGSACMIESVEMSYGAASRFWLASMVAKRLICFSECNSPGFLQSAPLKALTGGDPVRIEEKNKPVYKMMLDCKLMFFSNEHPLVTSQKSDLRRIIPCEISPISGSADPQYDVKLKSEAAEFLAHCLVEYHRLCPQHGQIPCDIVVEELAESADANFELFVRDCLSLPPPGFDPERMSDGFYMMPLELMKTMKEFGIFTPKEQNKLKAHLKRRHKIEKRGIRLQDGTTVYAYYGAKILTRPFTPPVEESKH